MSEQRWPSIVVYSTADCGDCRRSEALLRRFGVPFTEISLEEHPEATQDVIRLNNGRRTLPTIIIDGSTVLAEPSDPELAAALGISL
jgi:mycoredoxin